MSTLSGYSFNCTLVQIPYLTCELPSVTKGVSILYQIIALRGLSEPNIPPYGVAWTHSHFGQAAQKPWALLEQGIQCSTWSFLICQVNNFPTRQPPFFNIHVLKVCAQMSFPFPCACIAKCVWTNGKDASSCSVAGHRIGHACFLLKALLDFSGNLAGASFRTLLPPPAHGPALKQVLRFQPKPGNLRTGSCFTESGPLN